MNRVNFDRAITMLDWVIANGSTAGYVFDMSEYVQETRCGTAACFAGHLALSVPDLGMRVARFPFMVGEHLALAHADSGLPITFGHGNYVAQWLRVPLAVAEGLCIGVFSFYKGVPLHAVRAVAVRKLLLELFK